MKQTTLDEIIERDVPEELYFKKKDWENKQRGKILREFIEQMGNSQEYGDLSQRALVNLASEMAKKQ